MTQAADMDLAIGALRQRYLAGDITPAEVIEHVLKKIKEHDSNPIWITVLEETQLQAYIDRLDELDPATAPLYGIPFAIKDNIDLAGIATTAACPEYSYTPSESAYAIQCLIDAGAIPIGKTNLDQFATGLVGTRSPYGAVNNAFNDAYISGGSSSGSAVAVALGQVSFSLGTDTAGSGRIPAAFNNLFGLKPSRGRISNRGVVPACRSLDCLNVFALNPDDTHIVFNVLDSYDEKDSYARKINQPGRVFNKTLRVGVPRDEQLRFFGNEEYPRCFNRWLESLSGQGCEIVRIDYEPFKRAAEMLYQGPWVAERYAAIESFIEAKSDALYPVTRQIIEPAKKGDALSCFKYQYALQDLKRQADAILEDVDLIVTPTAGTHYTLADVEKEPIQYNSNLGYYTNFMNLLDYAAVAIPAGFTSERLPFGVTLFSDVNTDRQLLETARLFFSQGLAKTGATQHAWRPETNSGSFAENEYIDVAVCGAHLSGMPLNHQLTDRQAVLIQATKTAACYRLYALAGGPPYRPGLVRDEAQGSAIEVEVWRLPVQRFGEFMAGIPQPLGIGKVLLADNQLVNGFICEPYALGDGEEITHMGSWRQYMATRNQP